MAQFRIEHVAPKPRGWRVRTKRTGHHELRIAFPPGPRRTGSGKLLEILHPKGERNPECELAGKNPAELVIFGNPSWMKIDGVVGKVIDTRGSGLTLEYLLETKDGKQVWMKPRHRPRTANARSQNADLYDAIRPHDRVTIVDHEGHQRTGRAVMLGPAGWVLNMGGPHGTPAIAHSDNVTRVKKSNQSEPPIGWQQWQDQMYKRITKILKARGKTDNYTLGDLEQAEKTADRQLRAELGGGYERNARRRNQSDGTGQAVKLFQTFHGKDPRGIIEKHVSDAMRMEYTALGALEYLLVENESGDKVKINFQGDGVTLASSPQANQLYFIGGNQNLSPCLGKFTDDETKDFIDLGDALEVQYLARKAQGNFEPVKYFHQFGEEKRGSDLPRAIYDKLRKQVFLAGGEYTIEQPGIIN